MSGQSISREARKAAIAAYKERKVVSGIYAIRCTTTDEKWVGYAPDLSTIWNRISSELRYNSPRYRTLQLAWNEQGANNFSFEAIEHFEEDEHPFALDQHRKERIEHWCSTLAATKI